MKDNKTMQKYNRKLQNKNLVLQKNNKIDNLLRRMTEKKI